MSVERNNGLIKAHFQRDEDGQPEDIYVNELCAPDKYKQGEYRWWYSEGAFPQR
jgi:hypothetical protein